ncbi:MAG: LON peptidase substrate-binding domain-containing protein [Akkermansiaceae bacterium]
MSSLSIPKTAGVMLLPDTVLLPHGGMPLHIFEPRYRQMLDEALERDCMFCIGNLLGDDSSDPDRCAAPVGTVGLIRASRESENGTSNLLLHGVFRVAFEEWLNDKPYPHARLRPMIDTTLPEAEGKTQLARLRLTIRKVLAGFPPEVTEQMDATLDKAGDPGTVSDAVAQQFIHDPNDRQRLLETTEVRERLDFLIHFLENAGPSV